MIYPNYLTQEELERWAYITGDLLTAHLAAEIDDKQLEIDLLEEIR